MNLGRVLVKACLNGPRDVGEHPAIPVTHQELARAARQAVDAGAGAIHIHPRDEDGHESLDPQDCARALEAVRRACPGVPIGLTTGLWIARDVAHRRALISSWKTLPDFVSVNFSEDGAEELAELALSRRIGIEPGLSAVSDAQRLAASGLARQSLRILVEIDEEEDPTDALGLASQIDQVLDWQTIDRPRLHHGHGLATWDVIERAIGRGYDIRIGLEDTLVMPDGRQARDNAELVAAAVAMIPAGSAREVGLAT